MSSSPSNGAASSRAGVIFRLQQASLVLSWSVFVTSLTSSLGWSSLWVSLSVAVVTSGVEIYLLWRGNKEGNLQADVIQLSQSTTSNFVEHDDVKIPADGLSTTHIVPALTRSVGPPATSIPTIYRTGWIWWRIIFAAFWVASFAAVLVVTLLHNAYVLDYYFAFLPSRIIEMIFVAAQVGVMITLSVLTVKERKRILGEKGQEGATG